MRCSYGNGSHLREKGDLGMYGGEGGVRVVGEARAGVLRFVNLNRH